MQTQNEPLRLAGLLYILRVAQENSLVDSGRDAGSCGPSRSRVLWRMVDAKTLLRDEDPFYEKKQSATRIQAQTISSIQEEPPRALRPPQAYFVAAHYSPTDRAHQSRCAAHARQGPPAAQPCVSRVLASYLPYIAIITPARSIDVSAKGKGERGMRHLRSDVPGLVDEPDAAVVARTRIEDPQRAPARLVRLL